MRPVQRRRDASASRGQRKSVERARVVDEDARPRRRVRDPIGEEIDEIAVIRHLAAVEIDVHRIDAKDAGVSAAGGQVRQCSPVRH